MQKTILFLLSGIFAFLAASFCAQEFVYQRKKAELLAQSIHLERYLPYVLQSLSRFALFPESGRNANANVILGPKLRRLANNGGFHHFQSTVKPFSLPPSSLVTAPFPWESSARRSYDGIEFSLLKELQKYDHWDLTDSAQFKNAMDNANLGKIGIDTLLIRVPRPAFQDLIQLGVLRLMECIKRRELLSGLQEVRHLAYLCYSTETREGLHAAESLLNAEKEAYIYGAKHNLIRKTDWKPIQEGPTFSELSEVNFQKYFSFYSTPELMERVFGAKGPSAARCAFIVGGMEENIKILPYIAARLPFERNWEPLISSMSKISLAADNGCRFYGGEYWKDPLAYSISWPRGFWNSVFGVFPYLRRITALSLLTEKLRSPEY